MAFGVPEATAIGAACASAGALLGVLIRGAIDVRLNKVQLSEQNRTAREQLEHQRKLAQEQLQQQQKMVEEQLRRQHQALIAQLDHQRELALQDRAEERARRLLEDRRLIYADVLAIATALASKLSTASWRQEKFEEEFAHIEWVSTPRKVRTTERSGFPQSLGESIEVDHPAWQERRIVLDIRREARAIKYTLAKHLPMLEMISPDDIASVVKEMYFLNMPDDDDLECSEALAALVSSAYSLRGKFLGLARKDIGGDVTIS